MNKIKLCIHCKKFIGYNDNKTFYLCWRKKEYSDFIGYTRKGEYCNQINTDGKCKDYKFSIIKYILKSKIKC